MAKTTVKNIKADFQTDRRGTKIVRVLIDFDNIKYKVYKLPVNRVGDKIAEKTRGRTYIKVHDHPDGLKIVYKRSSTLETKAVLYFDGLGNYFSNAIEYCTKIETYQNSRSKSSIVQDTLNGLV